MSTTAGTPYTPVKGNKQANPAALQVARTIAEREQPDLAILFGSQARGTQGPDSDIDVMLVTEKIPDEAERETAQEKAASDALEAWGGWIKLDLLWVDREQFRQNRRYNNSVETNAMREGIIMPKDTGSYSRHDFEDEETEYQHSWTNYDERIRHAETNLEEFIFSSENNRSDMATGRNAQKALENGLKGLLAAVEAPYEKTHDIGHLIGNAKHRGLLERDFRIGIPPKTYTAYETEEYLDRRKQPELTSYEDYLEKTKAATDFIIGRAKEVREENT